MYRVTNLGKTYYVNSCSVVDAVEKVIDYRLGGRRYQKLRELGYNEDTWKNMTPEEAERIIQSHNFNKNMPRHKKLNNRLSRNELFNYEKYKNVENFNYFMDLYRRQDLFTRETYLKEYVLNGVQINRRYREGNLYNSDIELIKNIQQNMVPLEEDLVLYRTNKEETVINGGGLEENPLLSCTALKDFVVADNRGSVKEVLEMYVDRGTLCAVSNNWEEVEVILNGENIEYEVLDEIVKDGVSHKKLHVHNKGGQN